MKDEDKKLVQKIKSGDRRSFEELLRKYEKKVLYIAYDVLGNYEDAKDVSQEVFLKIYHSIHTFRGDSKFSTWLHRVTVNFSINHKRKLARSKEWTVDDKIWKGFSIRDASEKPLRNIEREELNHKIQELLELLSNNQKKAFVLRHYQDLEIEEIAEIMECNPATVRVHLFRALQKMKDELRIFMKRE